MEIYTHICTRCQSEYNGGNATLPPPNWHWLGSKLFCADCSALPSTAAESLSKFNAFRHSSTDRSGVAMASTKAAPTPIAGIDHSEGEGEYELMLRSGVLLDLSDPDYARVTIQDIASGLSRETRFNGQIEGTYTVAAHCVIGSIIAPQEIAYDFLMHDAAEAFLKDIPTPLKKLIRHAYRPIEAMHEERLWKQFCVPMADKAADKRIDRIMLAAEKIAVRGEPDAIACRNLTHKDRPVLEEAIFLIKASRNDVWELKFLHQFTRIAPIKIVRSSASERKAAC
jgi:uncharacterized protein